MCVTQDTVDSEADFSGLGTCEIYKITGPPENTGFKIKINIHNPERRIVKKKRGNWSQK